jgi:glycine cleavage system pyridoxal-binding protein P
VTISFVGLSAYLVLLGIYSSAISISQDANLRREIRHLAIRESKLLDSIGLAQIEEEIKNRVLHVVRLNKTNVAEAEIPSTLDEEDVNRYVEDVLKEIRTIKREVSFKNENS